MRRKIDVTASEMMQLREQGLSNHDIARSLDISANTVRRYIGVQPGGMENLEAFRDVPSPRLAVKKEIVERAALLPKYAPKPVLEKYRIKDCMVEIDNDHRVMSIDVDGSFVIVPYDLIPELTEFLAWAMRERMEVSADVRAEQVQEP